MTQSFSSYRKIAVDDDLRREVCEIPGKKYIDPLHPSRRARVAAISDSAAAKLLLLFFRAIPLQVQHILGGRDRSETAMRQLPKGRVKSKNILRAGTPSHPLRRKWDFTKRRVVYLSFVVDKHKNLDAYVGKASSMGYTNSDYKGMRGRCGVYMAIRRSGQPRSKKRNPTLHERALMNSSNSSFIRVGATFPDSASAQQISILEDLFIIFMRVFTNKGKVNGYDYPEQHKLVEFWYVRDQ